MLDLVTLCIAVDDLFARRLEALEGIELKAAGIYLPLLRGRRAALEGWLDETPADDDVKPLRAELKTAAEEHRKLADTIYDQLVALGSAGGLADGVNEAAVKVRAAMFPQRLNRGMSARSRVRATKRVRSAAKRRRDLLAKLPALGGGTLADRVSDLVALGERMDALQSRIGDFRTPNKLKAKNAARRTDLIGLLGRFRACLADEVSERPELAHLDHALFAYLDELVASAPKRAADKSADEPAEQPAAHE